MRVNLGSGTGAPCCSVSAAAESGLGAVVSGTGLGGVRDCKWHGRRSPTVLCQLLSPHLGSRESLQDSEWGAQRGPSKISHASEQSPTRIDVPAPEPFYRFDYVIQRIRHQSAEKSLSSHFCGFTWNAGASRQGLNISSFAAGAYVALQEVSETEVMTLAALWAPLSSRILRLVSQCSSR